MRWLVLAAALVAGCASQPPTSTSPVATASPSSSPAATVPASPTAAANKIYFSRTGEQDCSVVRPVTRRLSDPTPKGALEALFAGPTSAERADGFSSLFSDDTKNAVRDVRVRMPKVYVNLTDIRTVIPGASSSCGSMQFLASARATVREFAGVQDVIFAINGKTSDFYEWVQLGCTPENNNCDDTPFA